MKDLTLKHEPLVKGGRKLVKQNVGNCQPSLPHEKKDGKRKNVRCVLIERKI